MSSDKQCEKHCHLKFKVSKASLIRFGKVNRSLREKRKFNLMRKSLNSFLTKSDKI